MLNFSILSTILILCISFIFLLFSYYLFKLAAGSMQITKLNMISYIFYFNIIIQSFIGSVIILIFNVPFNSVVDPVPFIFKIKGWIVVLYTMIMLPVGMIIASIFLKKYNTKILLDTYLKKPLLNLDKQGDVIIKFSLFLLSILCLIVLTYSYVKIGYVPIIKSFFINDELSLFQLRTKIARSFPGNVYFKNIFGLTLIPLLSFIWFTYYRKSRSLFDFLMFLLLFVGSFFMLTYDFAKSPFVLYLQGFVFLYIYLDGAINKKQLFKFFIISFVLLIISYALIVKKIDLNFLFSYNSGIVGRVFINQISGLYRHFQIFPEQVDFIGFSSLSQILTNEYSERSARIVLEITSPGWIQNNIGGVYNTLFVGEAWANFGWIGLIGSPLLVGFIIQTFYLILLSFKKTAISLSLLVYFSFKSNITGGFNDYIYNPINFALFIIILFIIFISFYLRTRLAKSNGK